MEDSIIIWNFLTREYPDTHQVIYLYVCGNVRSPNTAISQIKKITDKVFLPAMTEHYIQIVIKGFLEFKKSQYLKGEIQVKPIY